MRSLSPLKRHRYSPLRVLVLLLASAPLFAAPDLVKDDDGEYPDWIEIYNPGSLRVSLDGLSLSDEADRPAKWKFPAVSLDPGAFLVVFASGKDRRNPAAPLHTNFKLTTTEGFLGLFDADGLTALWQYAPYPPQETDFSYGVAMNATYFDLVPSGAPARTLIPSSGILAQDWIQVDFDDASWMPGNTGVGYDRNPDYLPLIGTTVRTQMDGISTSAYVRIPFTVENPTEMGVLTLRMKYDDGFIAYLNGSKVAERNAPSPPAWNSRSTALHDDPLAMIFEDFTIAGAAAILEQGPHVLAIHGLNDSLNSSDFLILPELTGTDSGTLQRDVRQFFAKGTPGVGNVPGYPGISVKPEFSRPGGVFTGTISVTLSSSSAQAAIRYTLDRSDPTASSTLYAGPIVLSASAMLRARTFESGLAPSPLTSESYLRLNADVQNFTSDLPLVVVDNFGAGGIPQDPLQPAFLAIFDRDGARSSLASVPQLSSRIGIKVRGSSTVGQPKPSYTLEVRDERGNDRDVEVLGMPADSDWVLYGPCCFDRALIRNAFIYELSNQVGRYAVRTRFVEAFVNTAGGSLSLSNYRATPASTPAGRA